MSSLSHDFYVQPMNQVYYEAIAMFALWTIAMIPLRGKARRIAASVGFVLAFALIVVFTIFGRISNQENELSLIPFISLVNAKKQPELYRTLFMNLLLFMPFGLSLPFALPERVKLKPLVAIFGGFSLSIVVEAAQYLFRIGRCETDDVIMNTVGTAVGVMSYVTVFVVMKCLKRVSKR